MLVIDAANGHVDVNGVRYYRGTGGGRTPFVVNCLTGDLESNGRRIARAQTSPQAGFVVDDSQLWKYNGNVVVGENPSDLDYDLQMDRIHLGGPWQRGYANVTVAANVHVFFNPFASGDFS